MEHGLPFIALFYSNIIVPPPHIELGEITGSAELVYQLGNEQERVSVLDGHLIQLPIILD